MFELQRHKVHGGAQRKLSEPGFGEIQGLGRTRISMMGRVSHRRKEKGNIEQGTRKDEGRRKGMFKVQGTRYKVQGKERTCSTGAGLYL
ncbi:hypothetical protein SY85_05535 [Flavisolibacter tropicus]|uniref:Uncharacterized protein n=1 Tax=Flavisolibacter tropicus TaxID=1492898 RepID=A0A172TTF1_9BACT|nr:hypothetical protein SY85_05535 [Flavisolibacter tropicus]